MSRRWGRSALLAFVLFGLGIFRPGAAEAAFNLRIVSASFDQHFNPGDPVSFHVRVKNNEATNQFAEVDISITNLETGAELTLVPVLTQTVLANDGAGFDISYIASNGDAPTQSGASSAIPKGSYTVAFTLFDGNGDRSDQLRGKYPLHVGTETESVRVFPEIINLGTIPPGRYMHPVPFEVTWNYFRFNRLRVDQPFAIRIYTDNGPRYHGISKALRQVSPAGLVSLDGRYTIPVKVWTLNFGPDVQETGWDNSLAGPPPVDDDDYWIGPPLLEGSRSLGSANWVRVPDLTDMTTNPVTWRRLIGQDPTDNRFVSDINPTGDFTLRSPFTVYMATEAGPSAVAGAYSMTLVVELWTP